MPVYLILLIVMIFLQGLSLSPGFNRLAQGECITCHNDFAEKPEIHPQLESTCDICHIQVGEEHPGNSEKEFVLSDGIPALCFVCHTDIEEHLSSDPYVHFQVTDTLSCIRCHDPHSSAYPRLLNESGKDLCLGCHNKTIVTGSSKIMNIGQVISKARSVHTAIESGGCIICHAPHYSEMRALLIGEFPSEQYVNASPEIYGLCFLCHDSDLLEAPETEYGTEFRNGNRNLHYIHSHGEKGRNCTMCHNVHAGQYEKLIADRITYGKWEFNLSFQTTENGGTCLSACHDRKEYDRTVPQPVMP
jgi:predicted CXXCH cytochrome family protein